MSLDEQRGRRASHVAAAKVKSAKIFDKYAASSAKPKATDAIVVLASDTLLAKAPPANKTTLVQAPPAPAGGGAEEFSDDDT